MTSHICKTLNIVNKTNKQLFYVFELFHLKLVHIRIGIVKKHEFSLPANIVTLLYLKRSLFLSLCIVCFSKTPPIFFFKSMKAANQTLL